MAKYLTEADTRRAKSTGVLDLSNRGLTSLPAVVTRFTRLRVLRLGGNRLTTLPPEILRLNGLQVLNLQGNRLSTLPDTIGRLTSLQELNLQGNQLTGLPDTIGRLTALRDLNLYGNRLAALPAGFDRLTGLRELNLGFNPLRTVPYPLTGLAGLHTLDLYKTGLTTLPEALFRLTALRSLNLGGNQLGQVPDSVVRLSALHQLNLYNVGLTDLPAALGRLTALRSLNLEANELTTLPESLGQLRELRLLNLSRNSLSQLPEVVFSLPALERLLSNDNAITDLAAAVGWLRELKVLSLDRNDLRRLPPDLADLLDNGLELHVEGNPFEEGLRAMVGRRGHQDLSEYLRSLTQSAVPQYEAKVLVVGEGEVGKSSLVAALRGEPFLAGRDTTHGTEINELRLPHPEAERMLTLRVWDFGGQPVYRITHQFFFTPRALYLLVWHPRQGEDRDEVEGWLRRIRLRVGSDVGVLLVSTHADDGRRAELDYGRLERLFPGMLRGQFTVDSRTGTGVDELRRAVAEHAARLPFMGDPMHERWAAARDAVMRRAKDEPHISYDAFEAACGELGVEPEHAALLARVMAERGQIVHYADDDGLGDVVVLNPELLTKAISRVIEDAPTGDAGGILLHGRLAEIWAARPDTPNYPRALHPYLLRLMEKFDISFRLPGPPHRSLVAQLAPYTQPALPWTTGGPLPAGRRALRLVAKLAEPAPPGVIAWLTVRHHADSTGHSWRGGVFLRHHIDAYDSEALLELATDTELALEVRAPSPDLYFHELRGSIEFLLRDRWPGLAYELLVPCPTREPDGRACPGRFRLTLLHRRRDKGRASIDCEECDVEHDLQALLTGYQAPIVDPNTAVAKPADVALGLRLHLQSARADSPRLFSLEETNAPLPVRATGQRRMRLTLWCEHPGEEHRDKSYDFDLPGKALANASPYLRRAAALLQVVSLVASVVTIGVPVLDQGLLGGATSEEAARRAEYARALPQSAEFTDAEKEGLRELRALLRRLDPDAIYGGMAPMHDPSGDIRWVCREHRSFYDPGLPVVP